jgi:pimeloyl-ACP methyl ester carboxylesterase
MPGGPADAATFRRVEQPLAEHYAVVTYDPRGLSHS